MSVLCQLAGCTWPRRRRPGTGRRRGVGNCGGPPGRAGGAGAGGTHPEPAPPNARFIYLPLCFETACVPTHPRGCSRSTLTKIITPVSGREAGQPAPLHTASADGLERVRGAARGGGPRSPPRTSLVPWMEAGHHTSERTGPVHFTLTRAPTPAPTPAGTSQLRGFKRDEVRLAAGPGGHRCVSATERRTADHHVQLQ